MAVMEYVLVHAPLISGFQRKRSEKAILYLNYISVDIFEAEINA